MEDRDVDYHAHKEALQAVRDKRFDAAVARPHHVKDALGLEGTNWTSLLRFDSSQTLWAAGGRLTPEYRAALTGALLALARLSPKKQQELKLPDRVRNLVPIDTKALKDLEDALHRDLQLFERPTPPVVRPQEVSQ